MLQRHAEVMAEVRSGTHVRPLVDEDYMRTLHPKVLQMLPRQFDADNASGFPAQVRALEEIGTKSQFPAALVFNVHRLAGGAALAGALELERLARALPRRPSAAAFAALWEALEATRRRLMALGLLPDVDSDMSCTYHGTYMSADDRYDRYDRYRYDRPLPRSEFISLTQSDLSD